MERKEAIEVIKKNWPDSSFTMLREALETLIPELKEGEDERIRKALKEYFINSFQNNGVAAICGVHIKDILAWLEKQGEHAKFRDSIQVGDKVTRNEDGVLVNLSQLKRVAKKDEKQGEQKPTWSEEDEVKINRIVACLENLNVADNDILLKDVNWLKSLKDRVQPKQEWSEEDEKMIGNIRSIIEKYAFSQSAVDVNGELCEKEYIEADNWLKYLIPYNTWKPSEGQLECLGYAIEKAEKDWSPLANNRIYLTLKALKEQLKKL